MPQAYAHFVHMYDVDVHYSICPETEPEKSGNDSCLITIDGLGTYRARPLRGLETMRQFRYSNLLITPHKTYILIEIIQAPN